MPHHYRNLALGLVVLTIVSAAAIAQRGRPGLPFARRHTATQSDGLRLVPSDQAPPRGAEVSIEIVGSSRVIRSNGLPNHHTGAFPNRGNPHRIAEQSYAYRVPANPRPADRVTRLGMQNFGVAVNGVPFDPGAAEWYRRDRRGGWRYEALSGAVSLGIDHNHAHVQPTGAYHYHGLPTGLLEELGVRPGEHSPIVGWAADGFPIYALYGYADPDDAASGVAELSSSYRLRDERRPTGRGNPGGQPDGTFLSDYEFQSGLGDLDRCNGRHCVTPDYPEGTYAYFLTNDWPVVPRYFRGTPSEDFRRGPPGRTPR